MGKTGKWLRNFLTGKKDRKENDCKNGRDHQNFTVFNVNEHHPATPLTIPQPTTPREKRRWSFRRSSATAPGRHGSNSLENIAFTTPYVMDHQLENDAKKHVLAVAVATAAAADAAVAAAKAAAAMIQLTAASAERVSSAIEEAAAVKIQSVFRSYLARKALKALKGLVKLQALVRGHLVRKQANATLRCMQALITAQARARVRRMLFSEESKNMNHKQYNHRKSTQEYKYTNSSHDFDRGLEENIKIVEMDLGNYKPVTKRRNSYSNHAQAEKTEHRISTHRISVKQDHQQISPSPSAIADITPRTCSNHFEEYSYGTAQTSPQCCYSAMSRSEYAESAYNEYPFYPNYMTYTESSKAKVRSHSAPKQRLVEPFEKPLSRRKPSLEGRNVPRVVRIQRSSSNVGSSAQNYQYPWSVKLDRSTFSLKDSECGSTSTVLTNTNYCRSLVGFDVQGARF